MVKLTLKAPGESQGLLRAPQRLCLLSGKKGGRSLGRRGQEKGNCQGDGAGTQAGTLARMHTHTHAHIHMHAHPYKYMHMYRHRHNIHTGVHTHMKCMSTCIHTHALTCILHACTYSTHVHKHTHMHALSPGFPLPLQVQTALLCPAVPPSPSLLLAPPQAQPPHPTSRPNPDCWFLEHLQAPSHSWLCMAPLSFHWVPTPPFGSLLT